MLALKHELEAILVRDPISKQTKVAIMICSVQLSQYSIQILNYLSFKKVSSKALTDFQTSNSLLTSIKTSLSASFETNYCFLQSLDHVVLTYLNISK